MKKKNKILALLEIAIVLCSLFLVALPAIAAEQNQEMQKVSPNTIATASDDDFVLNIYGNANEDDTIDMRDLTYVKLIFFGKKPETELSDAKYDGKINPLDFIQIKLIIVGKEKELTIVDSAERIVTVKKPLGRVVALSGYHVEVIRIFGAADKIVGVSSTITKEEVYFSELSKLPSVGSQSNPDAEAILSLNPDLVIAWASHAAEIDEKLPNSIAVVGFTCYDPKTMMEEVKILGYILDKKNEERYYFDNFHDKYVDLVKARTEVLSEEEMPKIYVEWGSKAYCTYARSLQLGIAIAGGKDIFPEGYGNVDPEEVVMRNPDIIIKHASTMGPETGYGVDDPSKAKAVRDEIMSRPELANVNAVKSGRVYVMYLRLNYGLGYPVGTVYWAKCFHPALFEDLDPLAIHQEFIDRFCPGMDFDVYEHGVFAYPPVAS